MSPVCNVYDAMGDRHPENNQPKGAEHAHPDSWRYEAKSEGAAPPAVAPETASETWPDDTPVVRVFDPETNSMKTTLTLGQARTMAGKTK